MPSIEYVRITGNVECDDVLQQSFDISVSLSPDRALNLLWQ